jgi:hypothetical protein
MGEVALGDCDEVGDEIRPPLVDGLDLRPLGIDRLLAPNHPVVRCGRPPAKEDQTAEDDPQGEW